MHTDNNCCKLSIDYIAQMTSFCGLKVLQRFPLILLIREIHGLVLCSIDTSTET